jgi:hypothetical protein
MQFVGPLRQHLAEQYALGFVGLALEPHRRQTVFVGHGDEQFGLSRYAVHGDGRRVRNPVNK